MSPRLDPRPIPTPSVSLLERRTARDPFPQESTNTEPRRPARARMRVGFSLRVPVGRTQARDS